MPSNGPPPGTTCESCAGAGETLLAVRRVYLEADADGGLRVRTTVPEFEWWCPACRTIYPNELVCPGAPLAPDEASAPDDTGGG